MKKTAIGHLLVAHRTEFKKVYSKRVEDSALEKNDPTLGHLWLICEKGRGLSAHSPHLLRCTWQKCIHQKPQIVSAYEVLACLTRDHMQYMYALRESVVSF